MANDWGLGGGVWRSGRKGLGVRELKVMSGRSVGVCGGVGGGVCLLSLSEVIGGDRQDHISSLSSTNDILYF